MRAWHGLLALAGLLVLVASCVKSLAPVSAPPRELPPNDDMLQVGTAVADITPPLHLALFGHGPEGRVAAGVRTRLRCQVFVVRSEQQVVALVPCDLQSPSRNLHQGIASQLADAGLPITADRLYLMATHTHAGPAHYFEARRYSGPFSSPLPGYDEGVKQFLAGRIKDAIVDAFRDLKPACVGFAKSRLPGLTVNRAYLPFLRNDRAGAPKLADSQARLLRRARRADRLLARLGIGESEAQPSLLGAGGPGAGAADAGPVVAGGGAGAAGGGLAAGGGGGGGGGEVEEPIDDSGLSGPQIAVDAQLMVLRFDARSGSECSAAGPPRGVLAVYGMHPTGVPNTNDLYHGDIFGFATRTASTCLRKAHEKAARPPGSAELSWDAAAGEDPCADLDGPAQPNPGSKPGAGALPKVVVGLANGIEGDVSPKLDVQAFTTARRLGRRLGISIAEAAAGIRSVSARGSLLSVYRELTFANGIYADDGDKTLCPEGEMGMSATGGAPDGITRVRVIPEANPGFRLLVPYGCHTYKLPLRLGNGSSPFNYPLIGPISLLRLELTLADSTSERVWLGTIPGEATTMTGAGIRAALADAEAGHPQLTGLKTNLALVGLTNQYFQYFATAPEYDFQYYEGASTIYGPHSAEFLAYQFKCLALDAAQPGVSHCKGAHPPDEAVQPAAKLNEVAHVASQPSPIVDRMPRDEDAEPLVLEHLIWKRNYRGGALGWEMEFPALPPALLTDRTMLRMELLPGAQGGPPLDDDRGSSFELHEFVQEGKLRWRVRWIPYLGRGPAEPICGQLVRLAVRGRYQVESQPFVVDCESTRDARGKP